MTAQTEPAVLRASDPPLWPMRIYADSILCEEEFDKAIDAAMSAVKGEKG